MSHSSDEYNSESDEDEFELDFLKKKSAATQQQVAQKVSEEQKRVSEEEDDEDEQISQNSARITHDDPEDDDDASEESHEDVNIKQNERQQVACLQAKNSSETKVESSQKPHNGPPNKLNQAGHLAAVSNGAVIHLKKSSEKNGSLDSNSKKNEAVAKSPNISSKKQSQNYKEKIDPLEFDSDLEEIPNNQEDCKLIEPDTPISSVNTKNESKSKKKDDVRLYEEDEDSSSDEVISTAAFLLNVQFLE